MSTKRTSLTSDTTASFEKTEAQLETAVELEAVTLDDQSCDEVFFDVFVTKQLPFIVGCSGGAIEVEGKVTHDFEDYVSFQDASDQSFNKAGIAGKPELTVIGKVFEIITKKDSVTEKETKKAVINASIKFIFDEDTQKILTSPPVSVFALVKAVGKRTSTRHRWSGPEKSRHIVYALNEESGSSATLEVNLEECDKNGTGSVSGKDINNLSLGVVLTDFAVADVLVIGGPKGGTYTVYGTFVVWPVPTFANFYAVQFTNAELAAFDWGDLELSLEFKGDRQQAELIAFANSESGSLQYAPLGNSVKFKIIGNFNGRYDDNKSASLVALKGPGETVYRRTRREYSYVDPLTQKTVKGITPVDKAIKVGPTEIYCVDWINNVIVKGTGKAVALYSCPARVYNFKHDAPASEPYWTKWNCQASVGYHADDTTFGPLTGNGSFSIPSPFEALKSMWEKQKEDRIAYLKSLGFKTDFAVANA